MKSRSTPSALGGRRKDKATGAAETSIFESINAPQADIFPFLVAPSNNRKEFLSRIAKHIPYFQDIGFAGYKSRSALKQFLDWSIYGETATAQWVPVDPSSAMAVVSETLMRCSEKLSFPKVRLCLFPTLSEFVVKKMGGVSGFTPWKNTILIFLSGKPGWRTALRHSIAHELAHAYSENFFSRKTIADDLVSEGLAEHFREQVIGGPHSPWVKAIPKKTAEKLLKTVAPDLNTSSKTLYRDLFFGTGKFPFWAGYSIGYWLVKKNIDVMDVQWGKILQCPAKELMTTELIAKHSNNDR